MTADVSVEARRLVLQVGDVAGVARTLTAALRTEPAWGVEAVELNEPTSRGRVRHALELPQRGMAARRAIRRAVRSTNPAIVHLHWARFAPFISDIDLPLVAHAHGSDVRGRGTSLSGRLVQRSLRAAATTLVSTPDLLDEVGVPARYVPNPIDTDLYTPREALVPDRPTVLLFAQLIEVKGASVLIDAARLLRSRRPDIRVIAIGGGTRDEDAQAAGIEIVKRRPAAGVIELLHAAHVVVGQAKLGALGLSELEAMACGHPVIAHVRQGLYEDAPPVIAAQDANGIASACEDLLNAPDEALRLGQAARCYVLRHHAMSVVAKQLTAIYDELS